MESYNVIVRKSVWDEFSRISKKDSARIIEKLRLLATDPRPSGNIKLSAREIYRLRQGNYRIVYMIDNAARVVTVEKIGHRREIYRKI
jgi:mRNA interferase RelE/StbE